MNFAIEISDGKAIPSFAILFPKIGLKYKGAVYKIDNVSILTQENSKAVLGTVGGAAIGTALLGPIGLIAGALAGGNRNKTTLIIECHGGLKLIGIAPTKYVGAIFAVVQRLKDQPADFNNRAEWPERIKNNTVTLFNQYKNGNLDKDQRTRFNLILMLTAIVLTAAGVMLIMKVSTLAGWILLAVPLLIFPRISKNLRKDETKI